MSLSILFEDFINIDIGTIYTSYWAQVAPGMILISIPLKIIKGFGESLIGLFEISWTNWENKPCKYEGCVEFKCEKKRNIDWDGFVRENRYNLKAITKDIDFAGKQARIDPIVNDIKINLQPSWLMGQKRTGKTSIFYGVYRDLKKTNDFILAKTIYGGFAHDDPKIMIDQLVSVLAKQFLRSGDFDLALPVTNGSLVPLVKFIEDAHDLTGKNIYFMIDEFDEILIDFYKPNPISNSFWQSMRAISQMEYSGFLLVGGENIQHLKTSWGQDININTTHHSDIFKEDEYDDYKSLVQDPTKDELDFQDDAIQVIYKLTGGNPFFTKLLCRIIQKISCQSHNSYISNIEVNDALFDLISSDLQMDHFQHFIKDGIKADSATAEKHKFMRVGLLYQIAVLLQSEDDVDVSVLKKACLISGMEESDYDNVLSEFMAREILINNLNNIEFKIPLFKRFIKTRGSIELKRFFKDDEKLQRKFEEEERLRVKSEEIQAMVKKWGVYQDDLIQPESVLRYISQFEGLKLQRKIFEFLTKIRFITYDDLIAPLTRAHKFAIKDVIWEKARNTSVRHDIYISYLDGPGKSGAWIARKYLEINQISKENILELSKIQNVASGVTEKYPQMKVLMFIDDFAGTGNTLCGLIEKNKDMFVQLKSTGDVKVILFVSVCLEIARENILKYIKSVGIDIDFYQGEVLNDTENIFSDRSRYFNDPEEKDYMKAIFTKYGEKLVNSNPLGYGESQIAVVFPTNCPNNTVPILWESRIDWIPLFRRRKNI